MLLSVCITLVAPNLVPAIDGLATHEGLVRTEVALDAPAATGPSPLFFDRIIVDEGIERGDGLFKANLWLLDLAGLDLEDWSPAERGTAAFLFDAIFPFIMLILVSLVTRPNSEEVLRDFYARVNTPAHADPETDAQLVREKIDNPALVEQNKLWPGSSLEFWRPTRFDIVGFFVCIAFVLGIIGLYLIVADLARV